MGRKIKYIALYVLCTALLSQCKKPGCFKDAGGIILQQRLAKPFNRIDITGNINLVLTQDTTEKISVEGGEDILANIVTEITDNVLTIKNTTTCKWLREPSEKITVYLSFRDLVRLNYNGSGNVTSTKKIMADGITFYTDRGAGNIDIDLEAKRVYAYIYTDATDMVFRGRSDSCYVYTGERGTIDFKNFIVKHQQVGYGSIRDGYVHATESLNVIMYFKGRLFYKGAPLRITTDYQSTGTIIPMP
ncbi:MAG TPA: DUF2807 domain-containing protein [Flavisolibacter sp.]|nr:DUF2807 domain-containing protein [Flavisolibacter sp.]